MDGRLLKTLSLIAVLTMAIVGVSMAFAADDADADANEGIALYASDNSAVRLTFTNYEGGSETETFYVREGYPVELPTNLFTRDGYALTGWTGGSKSYLTGESVTITEGTTLYGVWTQVSGAHLTDVILGPGENYSMDPHSLADKTGFVTVYNMPSWLEKNAEIGEDAYSGNTAQPGSYLVYFSIKWINNPTYWWYTITIPAEMDTMLTVNFDLQGGSGSIATEYPRMGTGIILPGAESTTWAGSEKMNLVGWNITDADGNKGMYPLESLYIFDADATIEAVWEGQSNVLVYSMDGGSLENVYATITVSGQPQPLRTDAVKNGYEFLGWKVSQDQDLVYAPGLLVDLDDTTYLEAYFVPNGTQTVTVTFDAGKGNISEHISTQKVESGKYVMLPQYQVQYDGYEFRGWSTEPPTGDGVDDRAIIGSQHYRVTDNVTLYAVYYDPEPEEPEGPDDPETDPDPDPEPNIYTVVFDPNGGDMSYPIQEIAEGEKVSEPSDPMRDGMIFLGWAVLGSTDPWDFDNNLVQYSITLRAMWDDLFTISYDTDSEGLPRVTVTVDDTYKGSSSIEVYWGSPQDGNSPVVNGTASHSYKYTTWGYIVLSILWDGGTQTSRLPFSVQAEHYNPLNQYTVSFDTDGGSYVAPQIVEHGKTAKEPTPAPTKADNVFNSWVDSNGEPFDFDTPIYADTVLRATWTDQPVVEEPDETAAFFTITKTATGWTLDGSKSVNAESFEWFLDDASVGKGETFELKSSDVADGNHTVQLKVIGKDGKAYWADKQTITKGEQTGTNVYPDAKFTKSETATTWVFDGTTSKDAVEYQWYLDGQKLDGETGSKLTLQKSDLSPGTHTVKLEVESETENTDTFSDMIRIAGGGGGGGDDSNDWILYVCIVVAVIIIAVVIWRFAL